MTLDGNTEQLATDVIGAAIEVRRVLGPGFLESAYEEALGVELELRDLRYQRQVKLPLLYKERSVGDWRADMIVGDRQIVVELQAVESVLPIHQAQLLSYLKVTGIRLGLLMNFNAPTLKDGLHRRVL